MHKTDGYNKLVNEFGAGQVADRLLVKWLSDPDATQKWQKLAAQVIVQPHFRRRHVRPYKYWVVLWYVSMGYKAADIAEQLELSIHTIKRDLTLARQKLDLVGAPMTEVVARAIRLGIIP